MATIIFDTSKPPAYTALLLPLDSQRVLAHLLAKIRREGAELDQREFPCNECEGGEYVQVSGPSPSTGIMVFECDSCSHEVRFP